MATIPDKYIHLFKENVTLEDTANIPTAETIEDVLALITAMVYHIDKIGGLVDAVGKE